MAEVQHIKILNLVLLSKFNLRAENTIKKSDTYPCWQISDYRFLVSVFIYLLSAES
jgi:hypothetical protein